MVTTHNQSTPTASLRTYAGSVWNFLTTRVINPIMRFFLTRGIGAKTLMVLQFTGRKSGRTYTFPVGYMQKGQTLYCYSPFSWWRNLRGGAPVTVVLRGRSQTGIADVCTDTEQIAAGLDAYLRHNPGDARFYRVRLDEKRHPKPEDISQAAKNNVQIRIDLNEALPQ
jgi:hypothetical protein